MLNDWFTELKFETDWETFQKLPRHPAYRYQFLDGHCLIDARPVFYHARLNLKTFLDQRSDTQDLTASRVVSLQDVSANRLCSLFESAFAKTVPFQHLSNSQKQASAESLITRTRDEQDGPIVHPAALGLMNNSSNQLCGAIIPTLVPSGDFTNFSPDTWLQQPPQDAVSQSWGQPHLTWVFVDPRYSRQGLGQLLLRLSAQKLHDLGYQTLISTFLLGNSAGMLWHWRMGFELISHVSSQ